MRTTLLSLAILSALSTFTATSQTTSAQSTNKGAQPNQTSNRAGSRPQSPTAPKKATTTDGKKETPVAAKKKVQTSPPTPISLTGEVMTGGIDGMFVRAQNSGEFYYLDLGKQGETIESKTKLPSGETQRSSLTIAAGGIDSYMTLYYPNDKVTVQGLLRGTVSIDDLDVGPVVLQGVQMAGGAEEFRAVLIEENRRFKRIMVQSIDKVR
jgi:hypothetical protein